jgi:hypothetical protein
LEPKPEAMPAATNSDPAAKPTPPAAQPKAAMRNAAEFTLGVHYIASELSRLARSHCTPSSVAQVLERAMKFVRTNAAQVPVPEALPLVQLVAPSPDQPDPGELLKHRFLCREGGLLLVGPTGVGKSTLSIQMAISWGQGLAAFGITPTRPLKSLFIQAENDHAELAEIRDGILEAHFSAREAVSNVLVCREDRRTGMEFLDQVVRPLLHRHRPDLLWLDPGLAYIGGDASSQRDVGAFLRQGLNSLLHEFGCAVIIVLHVAKPSRNAEKQSWAAGDYAYSGLGSVEWANWARGILVLRNLGSHEVFELQAAKRGARLGWQSEDNKLTFTKILAHEKGRICWREAQPGEIETGGRPKSYDPQEILDLVPDEGIATEAWAKLAATECGVSKSTFHRERRAFEKAGRIRKSGGRWQIVVSPAGPA